MATNNSLKNQISNKKQGNNRVGQAQGTTMKGLLASSAVMKRFEEVLGKRANQFTASILSLYNSEKMLQKAEPMSVISSAMIAATLDLPVDKNLGYAWIVPYGGKAQFQMGYKGFIQLALGTGQYRNINVIEVYEGELVKWDRLTEEIELDFESRESDKVIGYTGYFELINGFRKTVYWSKEEIQKHKNKFSKSNYGWGKDWDAMAKKTVIRNLLNKWGILSIDMQKSVVSDNQVGSTDVNNLGEADENIIDGEFMEVDEGRGENEQSEADFDVNA